jgi:ribosome-binding factor A
MSEVRRKKVESLLKEEISGLITGGVVKDPRVHPMTAVTDVELSKDLRHAKVFVSFFGSGEERARCVEALNHAAGFIHNKLGGGLHLRFVPHLTFLADDSIERGVRLTQKIKDLFD